MAVRLRTLVVVTVLAIAIIAASGSVMGDVVIAQEVDDEVPPGNPVIGSDRPGDSEPRDTTSYGLLAALAVCLIGAGVLLVKLERWERQRSAHLSGP